MDLKTYRTIASAVNADLTAVLAKHGLKITKLNTGVDDLAGTIRYSIVAADANLKDKTGNATTPEAERWKRYASMLNLDPALLGTSITISGRQYKIAGMRETRSDKSVVLTRDDNRNVFTAPSAIRRLTQKIEVA